MFSNYLKIALRNIKRQKVYSFINITGLAIGMACCILILLYVQYELSYDKFHQNADRIYRVVQRANRSGQLVYRPAVVQAIGPGLVRDYPEVINAVRLERAPDLSARYKDKRFIESGFFYTDSTVFDIFTFPLVKGNPRTALVHPNSIIITEDIAGKYFGDEDPIEKILTIENNRAFKVTAIAKNVPQNSHVKFNFLASVSPSEFDPGRWIGFCYTYLLLSKDCAAEELENKLPDFILRNRGEQAQKILTLYLQPLTDIHLHSNMEFEIEPNGDIKVVRIFTIIAFLILFIACINFMNLSTARSARRGEEVGLRKIVGAHRFQLMGQFVSESILLTLIALPIAILVVMILLPYFNTLAERNIILEWGKNWILLVELLSLATFVGIISGSYPAFYLSQFQPATILKGGSKYGGSGSRFRRILVVSQFVIAIALIIGTLVIYDQLTFIRNKNLGFDKENTVVIPTVRADEVRNNYDAFKNELFNNPAITGVTASLAVPGQTITIDGFRESGAGNDQILLLNSLFVDYDFIETLGLELLEGRNFSRDFTTDAQDAFILNESAIQRFGWKSAVDKKIEYVHFKTGTIIGVVKDFHYRSLHQKIEPVVISLIPSNDYIREISVTVKPDDLKSTLAFLKNKWQTFTNRPFEYFFLDENFDQLHKTDEKLGTIIRYFTALAIFITCLGLSGLASFTAEQRTKEIGIRKVLGASVSGIIMLLTKEFTRWVFIANAIALPIAYYTMNHWLQGFAYRIKINLWTFFIASLIALIIVLFTVSYQAIKAALANPVDSIRYE